MKRVLLGPTGVSLLVLVFTAASALGSSFAHDQPRDPRASEQPPPRDFAIIGGTDRVGVHRRTIEFEPITTLYLNTDSTRLVDARRLLRAEPARGIIRPEHAITVIEPAKPKPGAKAFLRPDKERVDPAPQRAIQAAEEDGGWARLRVHRPGGETRTYEIRGEPVSRPVSTDRATRGMRRNAVPEVIPHRLPSRAHVHPHAHPQPRMGPHRYRVYVPHLQTQDHALYRYLRAKLLPHGVPGDVRLPAVD